MSFVRVQHPLGRVAGRRECVAQAGERPTGGAVAGQQIHVQAGGVRVKSTEPTDMRKQIVTALVTLLTSVVSFYFGSRTVEAAREIGISYLTLYGFSSENWKRSAGEVSDLLGLLRPMADLETRLELAHATAEAADGPVELARLLAEDAPEVAGLVL